MPLQYLTKLGGYESLNEGVHRKAADQVGHPALTRHIGFWEDCSRAEASRIDSLHEYFRKLSKHLESEKFSELWIPSRSNIPLNERGRVVSFKFRWRGLACTMRFEVATEFVTCTSTIDLSLIPVDQAGDPVDVSADDVRKLIAESFRSIEVKLKGDRYPFFHHEHYVLYTTIWSLFEEEVLNPQDICGENLGHIFADFRGLVGGDLYPWSPGKTTPEPARWPPTNSTRWPIPPLQPPFSRARHERGREHNDSRMSSSWARAQVERIWAFILVGGEHSEFTVSRFLDGRVLYISSLGSQTSNILEPVCYYMHSCTDDEWQLGRLIDRIHTLGTLRLAATVQLNALSGVNAHLKDIGERIETLKGLIRAYINRSNELRRNLNIMIPPEELDDDEEKILYIKNTLMREQDIARTLREPKRILDESFAKLASDVELMHDEFARSGFSPFGNIEDRIEQASYYIEKFKNDSAALRIKRLEGYQPYDEFVLRRLGGSFSFITLMAERFDIYRSNMALLNDAYINLDLSIAINGIREVSTISTKIDIDVDNQNRVMKEIQDVGEIVLFCVIAPNYLNETVIKLLLGETQADETLISLGLLCAIIVGCVFSMVRLIDSLLRRLRAARTSTKKPPSESSPLAKGTEKPRAKIRKSLVNFRSGLKEHRSYVIKFAAVFTILALACLGHFLHGVLGA